MPYRLRNFASNMYLRVWQQDDKIQYQGMTLERNEDTLFCFIPIDVGSSQVLKSGTSVVHICHFKTGLVLHAELRTSPTDLEHTREVCCLSHVVMSVIARSPPIETEPCPRHFTVS